MRLPAAGLTVLGMACHGTECVGVSEVKYGTLEVRLVDRLGQPVPAGRVSLFAATVRGVAGDALNLPWSRLPYGAYRVRVNAPRFEEKWESKAPD